MKPRIISNIDTNLKFYIILTQKNIFDQKRNQWQVKIYKSQKCSSNIINSLKHKILQKIMKYKLWKKKWT